MPQSWAATRSCSLLYSIEYRPNEGQRERERKKESDKKSEIRRGWQGASPNTRLACARVIATYNARQCVCTLQHGCASKTGPRRRRLSACNFASQGKARRYHNVVRRIKTLGSLHPKRTGKRRRRPAPALHTSRLRAARGRPVKGAQAGTAHVFD